MTKITILNNKKCQIVLNDESNYKKLHTYLSFKTDGVEYTAAYQNGWNGITYLLSKNGKFNIGLLNKVENWLKSKKIDYSIEDLRIPKIINESLDLSEKLKEHNLIPREHQIRIANLADTYDRGIIRACTGSGKSAAIALLIAKLNKPSIIYVIGLDLLDQFHKLFSKLFPEEIGYVGDGICNIQRITIASIWTIGRALNVDKKSISNDDEDLSEKDLNADNHLKIINMLKTAKVHCFDEGHIISTETATSIYKNIDPEYIYGFSGTPFKGDGSDLLMNSILGEQIINISASEMIEKGIIAQPIIKFITVPKVSGLTGSQYLSVYKDYIVENDIRNNLIVDNAKALLSKNYTPLVLFKQIKHGNILFEKMLDAGIKCGMLYGNDSLDKRNEIKEMLINKEIDVILASVIFDIGLNLEQLNALVLAGSGKSTVRALQRIGRVLRITPGKKFAAVIDFFDQAKYVKKHSQIRAKIYESEPGFKIIKSREMKKN